MEIQQSSYNKKHFGIENLDEHPSEKLNVKNVCYTKFEFSSKNNFSDRMVECLLNEEETLTVEI